MPPAVCAAELLDDRIRSSKEAVFLDGRSLSEVFVQYYGELFGYLLKTTNHRADAEDLVSQTFLKVARCHRQYRPDTNLRAWLYRIATNTFINWYRRRQREQHYLESGDSFKFHKVVDTPETLVLRRESVGLAQQAVEHLPEEYRTTAWLTFFREYRQDETAHTLDIPSGTAASRVYRARKMLQQDEGLYAALK